MANVDNLTAVLHGVEDLRLEQTDIEEPGEGEVLLKMACVGICGSDVHYLVNGRIGDFIVEKPMIIGHEASGTVVKVGKNVNNLKIGDRVAIEPGVPCRLCGFCKKGRYNLCEQMKFCATPPYHGNLRRFYKHAADFCYKLPDHVSFEEGALLEPLSVGLHACKRADIRIGTTVLVIGAGPVGLVTLLAAKAMGAKTVVLTDIDQKRLELAKEMGADATYLIKTSASEEDNVENILELFNNGPDVTIDASGAEASIRLAVLVTRSGGIVVIVGMGAKEVKIPLLHALVREIDIRGVFRYVNNYQDAVNLVAEQKTNIKAMVTHRFKIEETLKAFETSKSRDSGAVKVIITCE
ncbi:hypothetical protein QAD02_007006 [Eretmocerus hayati]|uniref:Uncharacterized protein n=1 Tax=Eretmocerus hayati TaxID=131215 RepID=A0ACC2N4V1_9HYME|nr:hypothetical protein QAD02_007006 [Eretmocerus hayati]